MGAKRVDGRDNGHSAKSYGNPVGVECEGCGRRALVPLDRLGNLDGDMRPKRPPGWAASFVAVEVDLLLAAPGCPRLPRNGGRTSVRRHGASSHNPGLKVR